MKTCRNCKCVYGDDYAGTCSDCGAPMGGISGSNQGDLAFKFARQAQTGSQETAQESRMRRGDYSGVKLEQAIIDVASSFIVVDEALLAKMEAQNAA